MENTVTLLLADYDRLKRVEEKLSQVLEFDKNKDRFVKIQFANYNHYDFIIKNSNDGDEALVDELNYLQKQNNELEQEVINLREELLKCQIVEHAKKKWSLWH